MSWPQPTPGRLPQAAPQPKRDAEREALADARVAFAVWLKRPPAGKGEIRVVCESRETACQKGREIAASYGGVFTKGREIAASYGGVFTDDAPVWDERLPTTWVEPIRFIPEHPLEKLAKEAP